MLNSSSKKQKTQVILTSSPVPQDSDGQVHTPGGTLQSLDSFLQETQAAFPSVGGIGELVTAVVFDMMFDGIGCG